MKWSKKTKIENRRKDKKEKSGPRVSNMQKKKSNFIQEKKTKQKNGRDENQKQFMKYFTSSRTCINRLKRLPSAQHNSWNQIPKTHLYRILEHWSQKEDSKLPDRKQITYEGRGISVVSHSLTATLKLRKWWRNAFKIIKVNDFSYGILCPATMLIDILICVHWVAI